VVAEILVHVLAAEVGEAVLLLREPGGPEWQGLGREPEVSEDFFDHGGIGEEGEDDHGDLAAQTGEGVDVEDPLQ